jgi:adenylate cyclase class IV
MESESGNLNFVRDSRNVNKTDKVLRVRVVTEEGVSSSFRGPKDNTGKDLSDVEIELFKGRDALFDEELYQEVFSHESSSNLSSLRRKLASYPILV